MNAHQPKVVIGTTLGEASDPIVAAGAEIARSMGAAIHLVHAFAPPPLIGVGGPFEPVAYEVPPTPQELVQSSREGMKEQAERLRIGGEELVLHAAQGAPHRVLCEVARREAADLVVIGAADFLAAQILGSTASRVVRKSPVPVLVLRGAMPVPPHKVLLPVDLSPISSEVVGRALALLEQWRGAGRQAAGQRAGGASERTGTDIEVEALNVVVPAGYEGFVPHFDLDGVERAAAERLGKFLAGAGCDGWGVSRLACFGGPREEILHRITETAPDLVIMGTHGLGGFERFMLGSVAEAVVRASRSSVLVIPPLAAGAGIEAPAASLAA